MGTKINSTQFTEVANVINRVFDLEMSEAQEIVEDGQIDGIELWSRSQALKALTAQCSDNPSCVIASLSRPFFTETLNAVFLNAAGTNAVIDSDTEVTQLESLLRDVILERFQKPFASLIETDYDIGNTSTSAKTIFTSLQSKYGTSLLSAEKISYLLSTSPQEIMDNVGSAQTLRHHIIPIRRDGQTNTVVAICYLPVTDRVPVSMPTALDFFIAGMKNYADITDLYGSIEIHGNSSTSSSEGQFKTTQWLSVMPAFGIDSSFQTQIDWLQLKDSEAFISRFSMIPGSQKSDNWKITAKQFEGVVIIRSVEDNGRKGIVIQLELDFDISNFEGYNLTPDFLVNFLMKDSVSKFCMQLVYEYMKHIETSE